MTDLLQVTSVLFLLSHSVLLPPPKMRVNLLRRVRHDAPVRGFEETMGVVSRLPVQTFSDEDS